MWKVISLYADVAVTTRKAHGMNIPKYYNVGKESATDGGNGFNSSSGKDILILESS
jgi:hypothetical protein